MSTSGPASSPASAPDVFDLLQESPFGELCRRRRDVTVVLLPVDGPRDHHDLASPDDAAQLAELARSLLAELETLWGRAVDVAHELWWQVAPGVQAFTLTAALRGLEPEGADGVASVDQLRVVAHHLLVSGWTVAATDDPGPEVRARRGPLRLRARALATSLEVDLVTDELRRDR